MPRSLRSPRGLAPSSLALMLALVACQTGPEPDLRVLSVPGAADTVVLSHGYLARALDDPAACRSPDAGHGLWAQPPRATQIGKAEIMADGRVAFADQVSGRVRLIAPDGQERAALGGRGQGPGEFTPYILIGRWAGDTIAVFDGPSARISLFTERGYARTWRTGDVAGLAGSGFMGRFPDGSTLFLIGVDAGHPPKEARVIRTGIPGPEWYPVVFRGRWGSMMVNLGRLTLAGLVGDEIVVQDDARPRVEILDSRGRTVPRALHDHGATRPVLRRAGRAQDHRLRPGPDRHGGPNRGGRCRQRRANGRISSPLNRQPVRLAGWLPRTILGHRIRTGRSAAR